MFECDGCGTRHGHATDMLDIPLLSKHARGGEWEAPEEVTMHACLDCSTASLRFTVREFDRICIRRSIRVDDPVAGFYADGEFVSTANAIDHGDDEISHHVKQAAEQLPQFLAGTKQ